MKQIELNEIIAFLQKEIAKETNIDVKEINPDEHMGAFGLDSINSVYVLDKLEKFLKIDLNPLLFWDYPTVKSLSQHLHEKITHGHS